ncbi:MAG: hypothetical protein ABIP53_00905 [Candidatus Limnocylindrales bacterium]
MTSIPGRLRAADRHTQIFVALCALVVPILLVAGHGVTFIADEWSFIYGRQGWDVTALMRPHNEHWSLVPVLIYKVLLATVGLRTYVPYQLVLLALHLATAAALFQLLRREAGDLIALLGATLFLVLGYGAENLLWPAEIGWSSAMAAGGWALVLCLREVRRADIGAAVLLVIAVASSGVGLFFVVVVTAATLLTTHDRRRLWILLPAVVSYCLWYLAFGQGAIGGLLDPARLSGVSEYVTLGVGNAFGRTTGWGPEPGVILAVLLIVATIWRALGDRPILFGAAVGLIGLLTQFALTALSRAQLGADQSASPRYVYTGAFFVLLVLGSWLATRVRTPVPRRPAVVLGALFAVAVASNLYGLTVVRSFLLNVSNDTRAAIQLITAYGGSAALPSNAGWMSVPTHDELAQLTASFGSLARDSVWPAAEPSAATLDSVLLDLVGGAIVVSDAQQTGQISPPDIGALVDATVRVESGCAILAPSGAQPSATASVSSGSSLVISSANGGSAGVSVSLYGPPVDKGMRAINMQPSTPRRVSVPNIGAGATWLVRFTLPVTGETRLCLDSQER